MGSIDPPQQRGRLQFYKAFFEVHDAAWVRKQLQRLAAVPLGAAGEEWFAWTPEPSDPGHRPVSYFIRWKACRLVLEGPSAAAVGVGWRQLQAALQPGAQARVAAGDDLARFLPSPRRHSADRPESWDREHQERVLRDFYASIRHRWAHRPHPALGGRTPAQAMQDPELRQRLETLLQRMQRVEQQRRSRSIPAISVDDLRRSLRDAASSEETCS